MDEVIYVVECSSGSWDSFHWWIGGIFNKREDAEACICELNAYAKKIKDDCPVKGNPSDMSEEDEHKYFTYYHNSGHDNYMEWREAKVKEYPINKSCKS